MVNRRAGGPFRTAVAHSVVALSLISTACQVQGQSSGSTVFQDASGTKHAWHINTAHALVWDGQPYIPVGGQFNARSLGDSTDGAWKLDQASLATMKAHGLLDIVIEPASPLYEVPTPALQRLIDFLEANGFRYGIGFGPGIDTPLTGAVIRPSMYRIEVTHDALTATWNVADSDTALYTVVDAANGNILRADVTPVRDGVASAPLEISSATAKAVAILFPHKAMKRHSEAIIPNVWASYDDYRDHTTSLLAHLKLGKGFRFFLDPLGPNIGTSGESDYLIPDASTFNVEWEAYLARKFATVDELKQAWKVNDDELKTVADLAQLEPLWANTNGVPYLFNPNSRHAYRVLDARASTWWQDFLNCRNGSLQYYMLAMADSLKATANVPVVYSWTQQSAIFVNPLPNSGFDGLAAPTSGLSPLARSIAPAYSAAEQSPHATWCLACDLSSGAVTSSTPATGATTLKTSLDLLRRTGFKGFFGASFGIPPTPGSGPSWDDQNDAMSTLAAVATTAPELAESKPHTLFFPQASPGPAHTGYVPGTTDVLWLPTLQPGEPLDFWPSYAGYNLVQAETPGMDTVLLSLNGKRDTRIWLSANVPGMIPTAKDIHAFHADGTPVIFKAVGPSEIEVTLDQSPIRFHTPGYRLTPIPAVKDAIEQFMELLRIAKANHIDAAETYESPLFRAQYEFDRKSYEAAYSLARPGLDELTALVQPYIWIEGESTKIQTFTDVAPNAEASSGAYLRLDTGVQPGRLGYGARYYFDVPADGEYNVWLAGTLPGPYTSPIRWKVNSDPERDPQNVVPPQTTYVSDRFGWTLLGTVHLAKGQSEAIGIFVTDRARATGHYLFAIDALLLTTKQFHPNATVRPLPVEIAPGKSAPVKKAH